MASKWINAILWTLVSVNLITLVLGGLVTWLGYAIPIRLKQFGLSPEITQMAGFASLLVACLGLGGLNYSSHYALNAYGLSCAIFIILMLFVALPNNLQRAIYSPSQAVASVSQQHHHHQDQQPHQQQQQMILSTTSASNTTSINGTTTSSTSSSSRLKPGQPHGGGLILDLLYIVLLFVLSVLLALAFILAQHLRRRELEEDEELTMVDRCDQELGPTASARSWPVTSSRRRLFSTMHFDNTATDWSCTCNERGAGGGGGINMGPASGLPQPHTGQVFAQATMGPTNMVAPNKEPGGGCDSGYQQQMVDDLGDEQDEEQEEAGLGVEEGAGEGDKIRFMQRIISGAKGGGGPHQPVSSHGGSANNSTNANGSTSNNNNNDQVNSIRWRSTQSATPNRWDQRRQLTEAGHQSSRLARHDDNNKAGRQAGLANTGAPRRLSSKSLANLANNENVNGVIEGPARQEAGGFNNGATSVSALPLVHKGTYYAGSGREQQQQQHNQQQTNETEVGEFRDDVGNGRFVTGAENGTVLYGTNHVRPRHQATMRPMHRSDSNDDHHSQQQHSQHRYRMRTIETAAAERCCCSELPVRRSCHNNSKAAATLAAKLEPPPNNDCNQALSFDDQCQPYDHRHHLSHNGSGGWRSAYNPNTMPSKFNLSSVYAIRSAATLNNPYGRAHEIAYRKHKQSKLSTGSVMAMTASAAAALLGGVALDPGAFGGHHDHGGGDLANSSAMDEGLDYGDSFMDHHDDRGCATIEDACHQLDDCTNLAPSSSNYNTNTISRQHH